MKPFEILKVAQNATPEEIQRAYLRRLSEIDVDRELDKFQRLEAARDALINTAGRKTKASESNMAGVMEMLERISTAHNEATNRREAALILLGDALPTSRTQGHLDKLAADLSETYGKDWAQGLPGAVYVSENFSEKQHKKRRLAYSGAVAFVLLLWTPYRIHKALVDPMFENAAQRWGGMAWVIISTGVILLFISYFWRRGNQKRAASDG